MSTEFFRVDASLMQQLGASLIADDLQCLVELIKNAYDADAQLVRVVIDAPDKIVVEDDGHGMDREAIKRGWLTISNSLKAEQKRRGELSPAHGRTPLGDKGLGRLSTQRLGDGLRIESVAQGSDTLITANINWASFTPGSNLTEVPVDVSETQANGRKVGTKVVITRLINADGWLRLQPGTLRSSLARLVSPYSEIASFRINAFLNGVEVTPEVIASNIRRASIQHFSFNFDGSTFRLDGEVRKATIRPGRVASKEEFESFFSVDDGKRFADFLMQLSASSGYGIHIPEEPNDPALCRFSVCREFTDVADQAKNPGPFYGEIDSYYIDYDGAEEIAEAAALDSRSLAKKLVKEYSGIRVYRDGFVVQTDEDWLGLNKSQTSGSSFYGLRPANTMGYVAISALNNSQLKETTNRQAFIEDHVYEGFRAILDSVVRTVNGLLSHVRRAWNLFVQQERLSVGSMVSSDPRQIEAQIEESFKQVRGTRERLQQVSAALASVTESGASSLFPANPQAIEVLKDAKDLVTEASETLDDVARQGGLSRILVAELDSLNERLGEVYELVSLGITAEALSHDISVILERLSVETSLVQKHGKSVNLDDQKVLRYFEVVRSTVSALEKQLGHLDPAMKYAREKREEFGILEFLNEAVRYYQTRFQNKEIDLKIDTEQDFTVIINRGKLIQILDNLVLNAEYWLGRLNQGGKVPGTVTITVSKPCLIIEDSGRGVEPAFESRLFEPFVTAKPKGEGRGLGLFIASQLLELDGCSLELLPERNSFGRRYRFAINFAGAMTHA